MLLLGYNKTGYVIRVSVNPRHHTTHGDGDATFQEEHGIDLLRILALALAFSLIIVNNVKTCNENLNRRKIFEIVTGR